ncbi:hypothetical protein O181_002908 [Austropuccinia psidii MF-1]|uniref:Integrase catalytic domain-containing protein n=1 Tax=Austropuccinia psidii MF-1 TaxID=1389203 RepID=A0A9Q3GD25_9BASI|nr:hypothetical protein [Austropuccinia psidii MF-1]
MDWVTGQPPGGDRSYNEFIVIVDSFSKTPIFFPCHKDCTAMDTALLIWNGVVSWTGVFTSINSDRDPKFTSELWKNIHQLFGTKLSFSKAYHPQTDDLAERMIQNWKTWSEDFVHMAWNSKIVMDSTMIGVHIYLHWSFNIKHLFMPVPIKLLLFYKKDGIPDYPKIS